MRYLSIVLCIASAFFAFEIFAQGCCTAGSSTFGGLERGVTGPGKIVTGLSIIQNNLSSTYDGGSKIADPLKRSADVSFINVEVEAGLSERVSLLIIAGYVTKKRETTIRSNETNSTEVISFQGKGISDITLLAKYQLIKPQIVSPWSASLGGGAKLPTGSYTQELNGSRLAIDIQPGTGATDMLFWSNVNYGFRALQLSLFMNFLYKYSGSNLDGYRFGDEIILSVNSEYYLTDYLTLSFAVRGRSAEKDYWGGRFLPSTGGTYIDILPSLIYSEGFYNLKVFYQAPLLRNVKGIQLVTSSILGAEASFEISL